MAISTVGDVNTPTFRTQLNAALARWDLDVIATPTTYYVRTDGNDANTGLVNNAAGAFRNIQTAISVVCSKLLMAQVTIQVADGTYTETATLRPWVGTVIPKLLGNITTPSNCIISNGSKGCIRTSNVDSPADLYNQHTNHWIIGGFKLVNSAWPGIKCDQFASISIAHPMDFGACATHMVILLGGSVEIGSNYAISGIVSTGNFHVNLSSGGSLHCAKGSFTATITNSPTFYSFIRATQLSLANIPFLSYSGSATGLRYEVSLNSLIHTNGKTLPGGTAGTVATGGLYT